MGKKLRRLLGSLAFLALLCAFVLAADRVTLRKESVVKFGPFFGDQEQYDALFVGDSHVVNGVFPMELWRDYGIASYNLASYGCTLPMSYWMMMNALDYASPKLIVIGVKDVDKDYKLGGSGGEAHTALDAFPLTRTKLRAIEDLMNDPEAECFEDSGASYRDLRWEYVFPLGKYHSRWSELTREDFFPTPGVQKGASMAVRVAEPRDYDILDEWDMQEEDGLGFDYLRRMIEECQARGIGVLLAHLPFPPSDENQRAANAVRPIAEEYGVDYVDFVNLDCVADYGADCYDTFSHLNPSGARKVTDFLGRYMAAHYALPDHRGEPAYASWDADYAAYLAYKRELLAGEGTLENVLMLLHDADMGASVTIGAGSAFYSDTRLMNLLQNVAREHVFEEDAFSMWSSALFPLERLDEAAAAGDAYAVDIARTGSGYACAISERAGGEVTSASGVHIAATNARTGETIAEWAFEL